MLILGASSSRLYRESFLHSVEYSKVFIYINILVFITFMILGTKHMVSNLKEDKFLSVQGQNPQWKRKA